MKTIAKSTPLHSEVTRRYVRATTTMPAFWQIEYRGETIWKRLHEPTEQDARDALAQHAARQKADDSSAPQRKWNPNNA